MFAYLKYFFLGSLILIIAASSFFTYSYRGMVQDILRTQNISNSKAIIVGFDNTVFKKNANNIAALEQIDAESRPSYLEFKQIFEDMTAYFNGMPVIAASFYTTNQELLFNYPYQEKDKMEIANNIRTLRKIGLSEPINFKTQQDEVIQNASYISVDGTKKTGAVLHSVLPLFDKDKKAAGAVEIFVEMSDSANALHHIQYIGAIFIIGVFFVLLFGLYWIVRRAEKIIAKQYEVNVELQTAKVAAESENEQKSQFLANISHELRTPLNAIIGFSEIMKDEILGALANEQYKNYVIDIHNQGVHLLSLINDILDFSKAEAGKLDLEYEEIDLNKLIKAAMRTQEPRAKNGEVALLDDLPQQHVVMQTDAKRLKQIMLNLLSNAVKFTPPQGSVTVAAWESVADNNICIEVADTGIGIAAKDIAKALSPFGQVDSELSRRYEGTGLGLPLTKKFTELLGGTMNLESELGKGTRITVILPKGAVEKISTETPAETPTGSNPDGSGGAAFDGFQEPKVS